MKQSTKWEESTWLKDLKIKAALPFEDTAFTIYYRAVLLRNVQFCEVVTIEDRVACVRMTNKFIYQAIETAFGIHNGEVDVNDVLKNISVEYDEEKAFYFFYIVYKELFRRNNPKSHKVLNKVRLYEFKEPFKSIFKDFDCKLAWDFILLDLVTQDLTKNMFAILWFRYRKSLLKCRAKEYREFVYKEYLKDIKNKTEFTRRKPEKDVYTSIIQRAERRYSDTEIFEEL